MKNDLDALMQSRNLDAVLVTGPAFHNPAMVYFTGPAHLGHADLIKPRGAPPLLFYNSMERDEAARTGLRTKALDDYHFIDLLQQCGGDWLQATAERYSRMLQDAGVSGGRMAVYGLRDAGQAYAVMTELRQRLPGLEIVGELQGSMLMEAMLTKETEEVERIRRMGQVTVAVVAQTAEFLCSHTAKDGVLVKADGAPLTIGEVKNRINLWIAEHGAENPEATIFSIGHDAGVPHSTGKPQDLLRLGETIVYDIFPCEAGGGYFYDFTRTWCLGYAPDAVQALYEDVHSVFNQVMSELQVGELFRKYQLRTCELFEQRGHPTVQGDPQTLVGYVHSLGHGVGLNIHERPISGVAASDSDRLYPGAVFTIEPGLYYPQRGMGVRLEDTVWARPDGQMEVLASYPLDLVLPVRQG